MDILFFLIPFSVFLALAVFVILGWALWGGQFDDIDKEAIRILREDEKS